MANKKLKVVSKGYTLSITSWENDGDNYRTKKFITQSKDEAKKVLHMCNNLLPSLGNKGYYSGLDIHLKEEIRDYFENNNMPLFSEEMLKEYSEIEEEKEELSFCTDFVSEWIYKLLGSSDYFCRMIDNIDVTYSPEDIYCEIVNLENE